MSRSNRISEWGDSTKAIHAAEVEASEVYALGSVVPPVYRSVIYRFGGGARLELRRGRPLKYSREDNPTVYAMERVLAALEGAESALGFASGMAAISTTLLGLLQPGARVVYSAHAYGTTIRLLRALSSKMNIVLDECFSSDELVERSDGRDYRIVFVETISNPLLHVAPVDEVARVCRGDDNCILVVDNTFATPILIKPLEHGADLVVHSLTKYIAGHNDVMGGVVAGPSRLVDEVLWEWRRMLGGVMDPESAYLVMRGAKTLKLRMEAHCRNAMAIAEHLVDHPKVVEVYYPGLPSHPSYDIARKLLPPGMYGGVVSFRIRGGRSAVEKFLSRLELVKPSPSLGGPESLVSYPIASSHHGLPRELLDKLGITEDLVRLSVGLEDVNDIIEDIDRALAAA